MTRPASQIVESRRQGSSRIAGRRNG